MSSLIASVSSLSSLLKAALEHLSRSLQSRAVYCNHREPKKCLQSLSSPGHMWQEFLNDTHQANFPLIWAWFTIFCLCCCPKQPTLASSCDSLLKWLLEFPGDIPTFLVNPALGGGRSLGTLEQHIEFGDTSAQSLWWENIPELTLCPDEKKWDGGKRTYVAHGGTELHRGPSSQHRAAEGQPQCGTDCRAWTPDSAHGCFGGDTVSVTHLFHPQHHKHRPFLI